MVVIVLHFVDGGVLDNRPFSYTIKEMYYRTANRPVDRKLFYIDPSPDRFSNAANFQNMVKPKNWTSDPRFFDWLTKLWKYC